MANRTYICFSCRTATRAESAPYPLESPRRCPSCRGELTAVSTQYCIPKKDDIKAWRKLAETRRPRQHQKRENSIEGMNLLARLDRAIEEHSQKPTSDDRNGLLKDLALERKEVIRRYRLVMVTEE